VSTRARTNLASRRVFRRPLMHLGRRDSFDQRDGMYRFLYTPFTYRSCSGVHFTAMFYQTSVVNRPEVLANKLIRIAYTSVDITSCTVLSVLLISTTIVRPRPVSIISGRAIGRSVRLGLFLLFFRFEKTTISRFKSRCRRQRLILIIVRTRHKPSLS